MSYSESKDGQVILTMSREDAQTEVLRLLREFDDRKMHADFQKWHTKRFGRKRLHARLADAHTDGGQGPRIAPPEERNP